MEKLQKISTTEFEPFADGLAQTFIQRWDMFPRQLDDGSYVCVKVPLTQDHIRSHLDGEITIGAYLLDEESQARFIVIDADDQEQMTKLTAVASNLAADGIPSYLEQSRRGGHLWLFFETHVAGRDARNFGRGIIAVHELGEVELYPKQDRLGEGPGSLIRLPFGLHRSDMKGYGFITPDGLPLAPKLNEQVLLLLNPQDIPEAVFAEFREVGEQQTAKPESKPSEPNGETLSARIKATITMEDFVGQFVLLSPKGRGYCPFHDDQHKSFSVNAEQNYWNCFADCGGGSVIDFWMKYQEIDFKTALGELAGILEI